MKRLSEHTTRIFSILAVTALAVTAVLQSFVWQVQTAEADSVHTETFSSVGTTSWTVPEGVESVEVLVVGGGGGGGGGGVAYSLGGGGGGGGVVYNANYTTGVTPGNSITVTVGGGGVGGDYNSGPESGTNGGNSVFGGITAYGGGGGGGNANGLAGGSGGGAGTYLDDHTGGSGTSGQGYAGGNSYYDNCYHWTCFCLCLWAESAGGGGGATGAGGSGHDQDDAGNGGPGYTSSISGSSVTYGGGGGGGTYSGTPGTGGSGGGGDGSKNADAESGTNGLGGGGGGAGTTGTSRDGGNGGSGVVIIKYTKFEKTLTTSTGTGGTVTTPGIGTYTYGKNQVVSVLATADSCYRFDSWTGTAVTAGKVADPNDASTTVTMTDNYTLTANFIWNCYDLTISSGDGGDVTTPGEGTFEDYAYGEEVSIIATSDDCYAFDYWSGDTDEIADIYDASTTITMNDHYSITANFRWDCYYLTTNSSSGGSVSTPGEDEYEYSYGQVVPIVATPDYCQLFVNWSGDTDEIADPNDASTTITMNGNYSITANFTFNSGGCFYLSTSAGTGGTVTTPGTGTYPYLSGTVVDIVATPGDCYAFSDWSGNTSTIDGVANSSTTITVDDNYTIQANFGRYTYILTVTNGSEGGSPYFVGSNPIDCGTIVSVYANTLPGYTFIGWSPPDAVVDDTEEETTLLMNDNTTLWSFYAVGTPTPTVTPTPTTPGNGSQSTMYLTWHVSQENFRLNSAGGYIIADILANMTSRMGKTLEKQLTIYIKQRVTEVSQGRGGIWGEDLIVGLDSMSISGEGNLFSGDLYVDGAVSVTGEGNMVSGTLYCDLLSKTGDGADFRCGGPESCPSVSFDEIEGKLGTPDDKFYANLSQGIEVLDDINNEYVFTTNVVLTDVDEVWQDNDPLTYTLKPGYYYSPGTITLSTGGVPTRGRVTFIADQIIIDNTTTGYGSTYYIGLEPFDADGLLLWSTGNGGTPNTFNNGDIMIKGDDGWRNACVRLEGVLFAPDGEIELQGSGPRLQGYERPILSRGAIMAKYLTIYGNEWWMYRW